MEASLLRQIHSRVLHRYVEEVWNLGHVESIDEFIHPDYVHHPLDPSATPSGKERFERDVRALRAAFPDLHHEIKDEIHDGDRVAVRLVARGTHQGSFFGVPPTGRRIAIDQMHVARFAHGKIIEHWSGCEFAQAIVAPMTSVLGPTPTPEADLRERLRENIRATFVEHTDAVPEVRTLARRLALSPRTLQRHLQRAGSSFSEEVDVVRRELASRYLIETNFPLREIASRLGFCGFSTFFRAFRRWHQTTPRRFRLAHGLPRTSSALSLRYGT